MKKVLFVSILAFAAYLVACKKSDSNDDNANKKPSQLIIGKWKIGKDSTVGYRNWQLVNAYNESIDTADYYEFTAAGKEYIYDASQQWRDTLDYRFINDSAIVISVSGDTSKILSLTDHQLKTYSRYYNDNPADGNFTDEYLDLKK